jgi:serine/threonine-protein kinase/endoribonuclease IRE1
MQREANIIRGTAPHLHRLAPLPDAHDLVALMTARDPDSRPTAGDVCRHPFFWTAERRLAFLVDFSDRLEQEDATLATGGGASALLLRVEAGAGAVVGRSWDRRLHR